MSIIPQSGLDIILAIVVLSVWSAAYRENFSFGLVEAAMLGFMGGHLMTIFIKTAWDQTVVPAIAGDGWSIAALILGLSTYTFFFRNYMLPYRAVIGATIAGNLFLTLRTAIAGRYAAMMAYMLPANWVSAISIACILTYFTYNKRTEKVFRIPRAIALYASMLPYYGFYVGMQMCQMASTISVLTYTMLNTAGIFVVVIAVSIVIIDIVRRRMRAPTTVPSIGTQAQKTGS